MPERRECAEWERALCSAGNNPKCSSIAGKCKAVGCQDTQPGKDDFLRGVPTHIQCPKKNRDRKRKQKDANDVRDKIESKHKQAVGGGEGRGKGKPTLAQAAPFSAFWWCAAKCKKRQSQAADSAQRTLQRAVAANGGSTSVMRRDAPRDPARDWRQRPAKCKYGLSIAASTATQALGRHSPHSSLCRPRRAAVAFNGVNKLNARQMNDVTTLTAAVAVAAAIRHPSWSSLCQATPAGIRPAAAPTALPVCAALRLRLRLRPRLLLSSSATTPTVGYVATPLPS